VKALPRALGLLPFAFYAAHAASLMSDGLAPHVLWSCHLANLILGAGILFRSPSLAGTGLLWLVIGLPLWVVEFTGGGDFHWTSTLTHVCGLVLSVFAVRAAGMPRGTWWKAAAGLGVLWLLCRAVTPPDANVNLSHRHWFGWEERLLPYPLYLVVVLALAAAVFLVVERLVRRLATSPTA